MAVDHQSCRFWQAALQSGAIDAASLEACWEAIPESRRSTDAIDRRLARQAVAAQKLSLWQAQQILAGRGFALKIDKYILIDLIGQGGMGRVYLARDTRLNRKVALKILSRERMNNPRALARFEREGKVGAQLQHDNLVRIYDEGNSNGLRYLVMEFIEGRNVGHLLADSGRIPVPAVAMIGRQVALGLEHARLKGLIHRDVNPQNILVTKDGIAKLTDMGLAIDLGDPDDIVTRDGATVGTFDYISPEQARHPREVDTRSDVYSLGCTLYHMVAGRIPFPTSSLPEKLYAHQLTEPEPLTQFVSELPPELDEIIRKMMAKRPDDRFQTPLEVAQALEPFCQGQATLTELLEAAAAAAAAAEIEVDTKQPVVVNGPSTGPTESSGTPPSSQSPTESTTAPGRPTLGTDPELVLQDIPEPGAENPPPAGSTASARAPALDGFNLPIDLGPELPLSDSIVVNRMRSRSRTSSSAERVVPSPRKPDGGPPSETARPAWQKPKILGAIAASIVLLVAIGWVLSSTFFRDGESPETAPADSTASDSGQPGTVPTIESRTDSMETSSESAPPATGWSFAVLPRGGSTPEPESSFQNALSRAAKGRGEVLIGDVKEEIVVKDVPMFVPAGTVVIRAAAETHPVLRIRLEGKTPFLRQLEGRIELRNLTFLVQGTASNPTDEAGALIEANDSLSVDHCTFVEVSSRGRETCALRNRGNGAEVKNSLFLGFDHPLILDAYQGSRSTVENCLFLWPIGTGQLKPGWVIRLQPHVSARPGGASLSISKCTVLRAAGLIETRVLDGAHPVQVVVKDSAIRADHLLTWAAPSEGDALLSGIDWTADGNRYDVQKPAWLVSDHEGLLVPDQSPTDLDSWRALVGDREGQASIQRVVELEEERALSSGSVEATRYQLETSEESAAGADLTQVGAATP